MARKASRGICGWIFAPKFDQMFRELVKTLSLPEADEAQIDKLGLVCDYLTSIDLPWLMI